MPFYSGASLFVVPDQVNSYAIIHTTPDGNETVRRDVSPSAVHDFFERWRA